MTWAADTAKALVETFEGVPSHPLALGVVVVDGDEREVVITGDASPESLFEIGSITKTMTGVVLAGLVAEGTVGLEAPVGTWLEAGENGGITLRELATHTSGLPRLAPNTFGRPDFDDADPYATFGPALAEEGLRDAERTEAGTVAYSNFGFQVLGLCLERATARTLPELFAERIFAPLAMASATCGPNDALLPGHADGVVVPPWRVLLHGPGGVCASAADMAVYAAAALAPPPGRLGEAISAATTPLVSRPGGGDQGLGWVRRPEGFLWHNGGTGGFRTMLAVDRATGRGAAVLANSADVDPDLAVLLVLAGQDPRTARPEPVDESWFEPVLAMLDALEREDFEAAHSAIAPEAGEVLTVELLCQTWTGTIEARGPVTGRSVLRAARRGRYVQVHAELDFGDTTMSVETHLDEQRRIAGIRLS